MKTALIIPTYQAEKFIPKLLSSIASQTLLPEKILIIDSSSTDKTLEKIQEYTDKYQHLKNIIQIKIIPKAEFNHGKTRDLGTREISAEIYIFMTQDAILAKNQSLENMIQCYPQDPKIGCVYGRQLPHENANLLASHARIFNYPEISIIKTYEDREKLGVKTYFNSDSFSSYRAEAYQDAGGFPSNTIVSEDAYLAAKMLIKNWKVKYCAEAQVFHSHNYSLKEEFTRYFDIGVFHASESWLLDHFASVNQEGRNYVISEWRLCFKQKALRALFFSILSIGAKLLGYQLGRNFKKLPLKICKKLSMHKGYWE